MNPKQIAFNFGFDGSQPVFQQKRVVSLGVMNPEVTVQDLVKKEKHHLCFDSLDLCHNETAVFHRMLEKPHLCYKRNLESRSETI